MLSGARSPREQAQPGQIDGHNAILAYLEETYGATSINWFWDSLDQSMFRDRNHLGDESRNYACKRIAEMLDKRLR